MCGSDWPVAILGRGYRRVWEQPLALLDDTNREAILAETHRGSTASRRSG